LNTKFVSIISNIVSVVALLVIFLTLSEGNFPLVSSYNSAFFVLFVIGFSMSVLAGIRDNPDGEFTIPKPFMIPVMIFGFLTVPLLILEIFNISLPILVNSKERFIALSLIIIVKWILIRSYNFSQWFQSRDQ
jgi:hypothetical protein